MAKRYLKVSEENKPAITQDTAVQVKTESPNTEVMVGPYADFTMKDLEMIKKFKNNGMLGLHTLHETDCERMMAFYLDGKTYREIAELTKRNKSLILFLAQKFKWFELRKEYLDELHATIKDKVVSSKLQSMDFLHHLSEELSKRLHLLSSESILH